MYGYFSNVRYQPNYNVAKCIQLENQVRKEVMKYEIKPLKNSDNAKQIIENTIEPRIEAVDKLKSQFNSPYFLNFNMWLYITFFAVSHIVRIRHHKKALSEMKYPFIHIFNCNMNAIFYTILFSCLTGTNKRANMETKIARGYMRKMKDKLNNLYVEKPVEAKA